MPFVFVGTQDYATGLMDAASLGFGTSSVSYAQSLDVSSFYALKTAIPSVAAFANSTDVSSFYALKTSLPSVVGLANSTDVSSFYALKTSLPSIAGLANSLDVSSFYALKTSVAGFANSSDVSSAHATFAHSTDVSSFYALKTMIPSVAGFANSIDVASFYAPQTSANTFTTTAAGGLVLLAPGIATFQKNSTDANPFAFTMEKSRGTLSVPLAVISGDAIGTLAFRGWDGTSTYQRGASFGARMVGSGAPTSMPMALQFSIAASGSVAPTIFMQTDWLNGLQVASLTTIDIRALHVMQGYHVSSLPYTGVLDGTLCMVTDATQTAILGLGLNPTGGGTNKVPAYFASGSWFQL